jgi:hypothetical protein
MIMGSSTASDLEDRQFIAESSCTIEATGFADTLALLMETKATLGRDAHRCPHLLRKRRGSLLFMAIIVAFHTDCHYAKTSQRRQLIK